MDYKTIGNGVLYTGMAGLLIGAGIGCKEVPPQMDMEEVVSEVVETLPYNPGEWDGGLLSDPIDDFREEMQDTYTGSSELQVIVDQQMGVIEGHAEYKGNDMTVFSVRHGPDGYTIDGRDLEKSEFELPVSMDHQEYKKAARGEFLKDLFLD